MNEDFTYIKLYRRILNNPVVCKDADHFSIWVYLLLVATHTEREKIFKGKKITLNPGQLITGRIAISEKLSISQSKVQRVLKNLENEQQIEQQTSNRNRLITILNWNDYQGNEQQIEQQVNNKRTTSEQPVNTYKNDKNVKNDKNDKKGKEKNTKKETYFPHDEKLNQAFLDFMEMRKKIKAPMTERAITMMIKKINKHDNDTAIQMLENSIINNWKDIYPLKEDDKKPKSTNKFNNFPQREYTSQQMSDIERALINKGLED